jgi:hypothetical protein
LQTQYKFSHTVTGIKKKNTTGTGNVSQVKAAQQKDIYYGKYLGIPSREVIILLEPA